MTRFADSWLAADVHAAVAAFCEQLRSGVDGAAKVPNLEWAVWDLGAHVACMPSLYRRQHDLGADFEPPSDWAAFSDHQRAHITERDPAALADLIEAEVSGYLAEIDELEEPRWLYGQQTTAGNIAAALLSEATLHGHDLAALTGAERRKIDRRQGNAIVDASMRLAPAFVDPAKVAALPEGTYHLRFRGGNDYTYRIADGGLEIEDGRVGKADAVMSAAPEAFAMISLGRGSQVAAGLTGKVMAYGRKPWRLMALGNIVADGV